jgi:hypothetical protein
VQRTFIQNQIHIKNIDKWNDAKATDFVKKKEDMQENTLNGIHTSATILETNADLQGSESTFEEQNVTINEQVRTV